jgi:hypothetical protein
MSRNDYSMPDMVWACAGIDHLLFVVRATKSRPYLTKDKVGE